jgi:peptide/nickel transport system permease protein
MMPGDPVYSHLGQHWTQEQYDSKAAELGLDKPIMVQFFRYLGELFTGNWGTSISINQGTPVWDLVWQRFPRTLDLTIFSVLISGVIGIKVGVISAKHRNRPKDTIVRGVSLVGVSIPVFWLGILLQFALTYQIPILPSSHYKTAYYPDPDFVTGFILIDSLISGKIYLAIDYLVHLILPVLCLSFITLASITRQTRSSMLEVLQQDYVRTARAKGAKEKDVMHTHALKNALIPTVTVIGLNFSGLLTGAILTETTFNFHGIGELLMASIVASDYYVLSALVFVSALIFVVINLFIDLLYGIVDPRIRY